MQHSVSVYIATLSPFYIQMYSHTCFIIVFLGLFYLSLHPTIFYGFWNIMHFVYCSLYWILSIVHSDFFFLSLKVLKGPYLHCDRLFIHCFHFQFKWIKILSLHFSDPLYPTFGAQFPEYAFVSPWHWNNWIIICRFLRKNWIKIPLFLFSDLSFINHICKFMWEEINTP